MKKTFIHRKNVTTALKLFAATILLFSIGGCGSSQTGPDRGAPLDLGITLKTNAYASLVDVVRITVQYPNEEDPRFEFELALDGNEINFSEQLDIGTNVAITISAFDEFGVLLYEGSETVNIVPGPNNVDIVLLPQGIMLRPSPISQTAPVSQTTPITVGIDLYNVENVFGAAFRIAYNQEVVEAVDVRIGEFLGGGVLSIPHIGSGFVAVGITKLDGESGSDPVDGSGRLAEIDFMPVGAGTADLEFVLEQIEISDPNGDPVVPAGELVLETGRIVIQ